MDAIDRFFSKIKIADNGCWVWTVDFSHNGYGFSTLTIKPSVLIALLMNYLRVRYRRALRLTIYAIKENVLTLGTWGR